MGEPAQITEAIDFYMVAYGIYDAMWSWPISTPAASSPSARWITTVQPSTP
ncbi:MAG: hypothetical protein R2710_29780 [Acidimicrobiales bacterium]